MTSKLTEALGTLFTKLVNRMIPGDGSYGDKMLAELDKRFARNRDPLLSGDLEAAAQSRYGARFPELMRVWPADLEPSIESDGRVITGDPMSVLAPRLLSTEGLKELYDARARVIARTLPRAIAGSVIAAAIAYGAFVAVGGIASVSSNARPSAADLSSTNATATNLNEDGKVLRDVWGKADRRAAEAEAKKEADKKAEEMKQRAAAEKARHEAGIRRAEVAATIISASAGIIAALLVGIGVLALSISRRLSLLASPAGVRAAVAKVLDEPSLTTETKESVVRYKRRIDKRNVFRLAMEQQYAQWKRDIAELPEIARDWTLQIGRATGTMLLRGALSGYRATQPVLLRLNDLHQNVMVFGGTGSGKTFSVLEPMMRQIAVLARRLRDAKSPLRVAMLVVGGKGNESITAAEVAEQTGAELRTVGILEGEYGFDLLDGLEPAQVSETINRLMDQLNGGGGKGSDPIWSSVAAQIVHSTAVLARAWEVTEGGQKHALTTGERIYAPATIYSIAMSIRSPSGLMQQAVRDVLTACADPDPKVHGPLKTLMSPELWSAIEFLRVEFAEYPQSAAGSFLVNVSNSLKGFVYHPAVRSRFGACSAPTLDIERIFDAGVITTLNLSPINIGDFARVVAVLFKTRCWHWAIAENIADKKISRKRKLVVFQDECQDVMSVGGALSEAGTLLNRSRESGLAFVFATQSIPALYQGLGQTTGSLAVDNLLDQCRTKIILQSEGEKTLAMVAALAGKAMRGTVIEADQHESRRAMLLEYGDRTMSDDIEPRTIDTDRAEQLAWTPSLVGRALTSAGLKKDLRIDWDMYAANVSGGGGLEPARTDWTEKLKSIVWRAKDKRDQAMSTGNEMADLIERDDSSLFGRGAAFVLTQSAGGQRMDFVELRTEYVGGMPDSDKPTNGA
jgi:hypothetical protein